MRINFIPPDEIGDFEDCISGEELECIKAGKNVAVGCRWDDGSGCGIISIKSSNGVEFEDGDNPVIDFFFVKEEYRKKKVFLSMISFVKKRISRMLGLEYDPKDSDGITGFGDLLKYLFGL